MFLFVGCTCKMNTVILLTTSKRRNRVGRVVADEMRPMRSRVHSLGRQIERRTHKHHQSTLQTPILQGLPLFFYCSAIRRGQPTRQSDRSDHSPNRFVGNCIATLDSVMQELIFI